VSKIRRPVDALPRKAAIAAALDKMQSDGCGFNPSLCPVAHRLKFAAVGYEQALQLATARAEYLGIAPKRQSEIIRAFRKVYNSNSNVKVEFESNGFHKVVQDVAYVEQICSVGLTSEQLKASAALRVPT
jgi:hypothetical protein